MGLFRRGDPRPVGEPATPQAADAALFAHGFVPYWFRRLGTASWYTIGIVIVLAGLVYALHALATLVVPALFAVLLARRSCRPSTGSSGTTSAARGAPSS